MIYKQAEHFTVYHGSCLDVMAQLPDSSVDSIVTDPPYELGFMGKSWDASGIAYNVEVWRQALRVLKPGGHLLAFSGSRTYHRMACAIEDAGFEIRDQIMWIYGSGFPKSLDISKAIDKGTGENRARQLRFTEWMRSTGITAKQIDEATGTAMGGHYLSALSQPAIATADLFDKLRHLLPEVPEEIERLVAERTGIEWTAYKQRQVVGTDKKADLKGSVYFGDLATAQKNGRAIGYGEWDITAPATAEAQQWEGWGTALKPAHEPIVVARKPLIGTVAANVLAYGTGGLNIDGCRVGRTEGDVSRGGFGNGGIGIGSTGNSKGEGKDAEWVESNRGRWPANVLFDEEAAAVLDGQSGISLPKSERVGVKGGSGFGFFDDEKTAGTIGRWPADTGGGASRFFYVAKASKRDRNEGLDGFEARQVFGDEGGTYQGLSNSNIPSQNFHPTVKPTQLMQYLVRLVTPPNGVVLDPFLGSGSTGKAAMREGFDFIGIELTDDYLPLAVARIESAERPLL